MIYNEFKDLKISGLAMGAMRLPVVNGVFTDIDMDETQKMVDYAMSHGVNYYDTAWGYHDGQSEIAMGKALSKYPREDFYLTTKFPGYDLANMDKVEEIFEEQLKKCGVEYFDFYLVHNVCELNLTDYLNPAHGIHEYLMKQKENGRILHLGFSAHGSLDVIKSFLDAYGKDMEFCQLQINYLDWTFQGAKEKVELVQKYNLPVWVMEPLRGGSLCKLSDENENRLKSIRPDETVTAWAFRFLQSIPAVKVILSGMSNYDQMVENIATFEEDKPLNEKEKETILDIAAGMLGKKTLPCTSCRYCTSHCPQELDIPNLISLYNEHKFTGGGFLAPFALKAMPEEKRPSACVACRNCEDVCPQQIKISEMMEDFNKMMEK